MAYSPRFAANIITAARRLHDNRTVAESSGDGTLRYSSDLLRQYQNMAIRDLVKDLYLQHGANVDSVIPELVSESGDITLTNNAGNMPADGWIILEASKNDYTLYYEKIDTNPLKVKNNRDPLIQPTASRPYFYQVGKTLQVLPVTPNLGPARIWYLQTPADTALDSVGEVALLPVWDGEIVNRMFAFGIADAKTSLAL